MHSSFSTCNSSNIIIMIISAEVYGGVLAYVTSQLEHGLDVDYELCSEFGIDRQVLWSIYNQVFVKRMKKITPHVEDCMTSIIEVYAVTCIYYLFPVMSIYHCFIFFAESEEWTKFIFDCKRNGIFTL